VGHFKRRRVTPKGKRVGHVDQQLAAEGVDRCQLQARSVPSIRWPAQPGPLRGPHSRTWPHAPAVHGVAGEASTLALGFATADHHVIYARNEAAGEVPAKGSSAKDGNLLSCFSSWLRWHERVLAAMRAEADVRQVRITHRAKAAA